MSDLSNRSLALLVGVAIVISVVGIFVAQKGPVITGLATDSETGIVNLTILSEASINVTENIEFGAGGVTGDSADLWSDNATSNGGNWSFSSQAILVENDGTLNMSVTIASDKNATAFIGGTLDGGPDFEYWVQEHEANSCVSGIGNGTGYDTGDLQEYIADATEIICDDLGITDAANILNVSAHVKIPKDATAELKTATWTFEGTT